MKYHMIATFNIDISEEIATDAYGAVKFVRNLINDIACDSEKTYVGFLKTEEQEKTDGGDK